MTDNLNGLSNTHRHHLANLLSLGIRHRLGIKTNLNKRNTNLANRVTQNVSLSNLLTAGALRRIFMMTLGAHLTRSVTQLMHGPTDEDVVVAENFLVLNLRLLKNGNTNVTRSVTYHLTV